MSQRERWIVYPLLFLAVMIGAWDKIVPSGKTRFDEVVCRQLRAQEIYCSEMQAVSLDGKKVLVRVGSTPEGSGQLHTFAWSGDQPTATVQIDRDGLKADTLDCRVLQVLNQGRLIGYLGPGSNGAGLFTLYSADGRQPAVVAMSNDDGGLFNVVSSDGAYGVALAHVANLSGMFGVYGEGELVTYPGEEQRYWGLYFPRPTQPVPQRSLTGEGGLEEGDVATSTVGPVEETPTSVQSRESDEEPSSSESVDSAGDGGSQ